jgi:hypothetical protein
MLRISRRRSRCGIRFHSSIRACSRSWKVCGRTGRPRTLMLSLSPHMLNGIKIGTHCWSFHLLKVQFSQDRSGDERYMALSCISKDSGSTPPLNGATNTCCSSICSMYLVMASLPRTTTRSVLPSILMPPCTITKSFPIRSPS